MYENSNLTGSHSLIDALCACACSDDKLTAFCCVYMSYTSLKETNTADTTPAPPPSPPLTRAVQVCINGPGLANFFVWASSEPFRNFCWGSCCCCCMKKHSAETFTSDTGASSHYLNDDYPGEGSDYERSLLQNGDYGDADEQHRGGGKGGGGAAAVRTRSESLDASFMANEVWGGDGEERGSRRSLQMSVDRSFERRSSHAEEQGARRSVQM